MPGAKQVPPLLFYFRLFNIPVILISIINHSHFTEKETEAQKHEEIFPIVIQPICGQMEFKQKAIYLPHTPFFDDRNEKGQERRPGAVS